jgi:hypothetical protein
MKAGKELIQSIEELKSIKAEEKEIAKSRLEAENKVKASMGNNESLVTENGDLLATWKNGKSRQVLDSKKLEQENEGIYQQYLATKEASRMFLVK